MEGENNPDGVASVTSEKAQAKPLKTLAAALEKLSRPKEERLFLTQEETYRLLKEI